MSNFPICPVEDIPNGRAIAREILLEERKLNILLVAQDTGEEDGDGRQYSAFLNSCPHTGVQLEWRPGDFMDQSNSYLQCSMHGALFQTNSGLCIEGPCVGENLYKLDTELKNGIIYLLNHEQIPASARGHK